MSFIEEQWRGKYLATEEFLAAIPMVFLGQAKEALDDIMAQLRADLPDAIITDELALAGRLAAWKLKLPMLMMFTSFAPCKAFSIFRTWPDFPGSPARAAAMKLAKEFQAEYGGPLHRLSGPVRGE